MSDAPGMQLLRMLRQALIFLLYAVIGAVLAGVVGFVWLGVRDKPDLKPWHTASLHEEFTRTDSPRVNTLEAYRKLEERLFGELQSEVYQRTDPSDRLQLNRYSAGSRVDPTAFTENFNRTFELTADAPRAGVILIHGLTDSPYVFRAVASRLHERGCWVVVLRLPGHGTAPSALTHIDWRDWAAAVRMAAKDLRKRLPAQTPLYLVGFSTGAALAVEYSLARLEGEQLPGADALVLLSPAIGVDPLAWLAVWQERASMLPGLGEVGVARPHSRIRPLQIQLLSGEGRPRDLHADAGHRRTPYDGLLPMDLCVASRARWCFSPWLMRRSRRMPWCRSFSAAWRGKAMSW